MARHGTGSSLGKARPAGILAGEKAKGQEMLGQVGSDITRVPKGHCPHNTRSQ